MSSRSATSPKPRTLLLLLLLLTSWATFPTGFIDTPSSYAANSIWYVNHAAGDVEDGTSWATAFKNLQAALESAQASNQIWVAKGVYYPTAVSSDRAASFVLKNGVALYGGFAGGESQLTQRDWQQHRTILSGDIDKNDLHVSGVVTNTSGITGTNSYHVVRAEDLDASAIIDGFVITAGWATNGPGSSDIRGGAIYNINSNTSISNMLFSGNKGDACGAMMNVLSNSIITNASFVANSATDNYAGAVCNLRSQVTITHSSFSKNTSHKTGGALTEILGSSTITHSSFSENRAQDQGGAIENDFSSPTISDSVFSANSSQDKGGAIYNHLTSSPTILRSIFSDNWAETSSGGAIYNTENSHMDLLDAHFSDNRAAQTGGAIFNDNGSATISNTHFFANSASAGGAMNSSTSSITITNSIFTSNTGIIGGAIVETLGVSTIANSSFIANVSDPNSSTSNILAGSGGAIISAVSNTKITNSRFSGNKAHSGSAVYAFLTSLSLTNATVAGNAATSSALVSENSNTDIHNSIVWGNSASLVISGTSSLTVTHSLIEGCKPGGNWNSACGSDGSGNLADADPLFVNPISHNEAPSSMGDLRLQSSSPAINAGNNGLNSSATDLGSNARIIDTLIDLGAYEALPKLYSFEVGKGTISYTPVLAHYPLTSTITFTATASPGWSFAGWSGDLSGTNSPTTLLIDSTKNITATFSNDPPTAKAGGDRAVLVATAVVLDGGASFDADPTQTLTYAWTQSAGTPVTLAGANTAKPSFSAPSTVGLLSFELVVTDSMGLASVADSVSVTVTNGQPIANAGPDQSVVGGSTVTLDGSASSDPDGHTPLRYSWRQTAGPAVMLNGANTARPTFNAPNVVGVLSFELIVTDSMGLVSVADRVTVQVDSHRLFLPLILR